MCGIAGIIGLKSDAEAQIRRMLDAMIHRGPDDEGIHVHGNSVLGQRRLSIIDLSGGHQPIPNEDETKWIVCNGEIYNYKSLRQDLLEKGHQFRTQSDSEVVLHLYEEYGEDCVNHLRGMFAFAVLDIRSGEVFLARDHLGQKPLYYHWDGNTFAFSSEIKSLLAWRPELAELNKNALNQYLTVRVIAAPLSMYQKIEKLPPAHAITLTRGQAPRVWRYWHLTYEPKLSGSDEDLTDALEEVLVEAIRLHMVSDVPVGAFLSGGLDSTLVLSLLMEHANPGTLDTFSFGLPYKQFDESPYAKMVAEKYGTRHHEEIITPSMTKNLPDLVHFLDEPSDPLSVCSYLISEMASKHVKVVLGGDGGDELFGGYDRYYGNKYAQTYAMIPSALRKLLLGPLLGLLPDGGWYKSKYHQIKWLHKLSFMSGADRYAASLGYFYFDERRRTSLLSDDMRAAVGSVDPAEQIKTAYQDAEAKDIIDRMLYADSCVRLPDHPVMILDRMTMAHSLEARAPLMDHKVAEFSARLPMRMKVRGRNLRVIQKALCQRYIPPEVLNRPKQGFSSALPYMLRDEYETLFGVFLTSPWLVRDGILNQAAIDSLLQEHRGRKVDHGNRLWLLLNSEVWYRMKIHGVEREDVRSMIASATRT